MKKFNEYINEELIFTENNEDIITEGFWKTVGSIFGFNTKKISKSMKNWSDEMKRGFTIGQYVAAKSNNKNVKDAYTKISQAAEEGKEKLYNSFKDIGKKWIKNLKDVTADAAMNVYVNLKQSSEEFKDDEGKQLAEQLSKEIKNQYPDAEKTYKEAANKVIKSGQIDKIQNDDQSNKEVQKEVNQETTDTIKENKDLLTPLAKEAGIDGKKLRNFVATQLRKTLGKDQENIKKKGSREAVQNALGEEVILGTCIMVLGALITKDDVKIQEISKLINSSSEELKNKLNNYK